MERKKFDEMKGKKEHKLFHNDNLRVSAGMCLPTAETAVAKTRPRSAITVKVNGMPMKANTYGNKCCFYFSFRLNPITYYIPNKILVHLSLQEQYCHSLFVFMLFVCLFVCVCVKWKRKNNKNKTQSKNDD